MFNGTCVTQWEQYFTQVFFNFEYIQTKWISSTNSKKTKKENENVTKQNWKGGNFYCGRKVSKIRINQRRSVEQWIIFTFIDWARVENKAELIPKNDELWFDEASE